MRNIDNTGFVLSNPSNNSILSEVNVLLTQLEHEDFTTQFWQEMGKVAELGKENGEPKLDWINGLHKVLHHPDWLDALLIEATEILADPEIKYIVWSGMGGSVMTLHCLKDLGLLENARFQLYILDSTDPAQLNQLLLTIANDQNIPLDDVTLPSLLSQMFMIGVSMGMTSEEPITHLRWFASLLTANNISPESHLRVLTLPHSYLHNFAEEYGVKRLNLQLDGSSNTPGRMSAPATKVFLLPAALQLLAQWDGDVEATKESLQKLLSISQNLYLRNNLEAEIVEDANLTTSLPSLINDPFVQLGGIITAYSRQGRNKVILRSSNNTWHPLFGWIEQIVEESLGKAGKGFLIFYDQDSDFLSDKCIILDINDRNITVKSQDHKFHLQMPDLSNYNQPNSLGKFILTCAFFAEFKKTVVTYALLENIVFAGQPAVEGYKRYAREIRDSGKLIQIPPDTQYQAVFGNLTLDYSAIINSNLVTQNEINDQVDKIYAKISGTALTSPQRYATLSQQRKMQKLFQSQMQQGIVSGEGVLEFGPEGNGWLKPTLTGSEVQRISISQSQIQQSMLNKGDYIEGKIRPPQGNESEFSLVRIEEINGQDPADVKQERTRLNRKAGLVYAAILLLSSQRNNLGYADITFNGVSSPALDAILSKTRQTLFNQTFNIPAKIRQAPQDYHSTEQSETDGPPDLVSLRLVAQKQDKIIFGEYSNRFLQAQTLGTLAAMQDAHRWILLLTMPDQADSSLANLADFFEVVQKAVM